MIIIAKNQWEFNKKRERMRKKTNLFFAVLTLLFLFLVALRYRENTSFVGREEYLVVTEARSGSMTPEIHYVNVNTATKEELCTLDGIGEVLAQRILEDREANGPYRSVEDLLRVKGIGEKTLEKIRDDIILEEEDLP